MAADDAPPPDRPDPPAPAPAADDAAPSASGRRRARASTSNALSDSVVSAADRLAEVTDAVSGKIGGVVGESLTHKVTEVAEAVGGKIGDVVGESLTHLPGVPRTRRGRVMARGVVVGFCLVFAWIAVIVGLQLRGRRPPDFRPLAEKILGELRDGKFEQVYDDETSSRFQEVVLLDTFVVHMEDLNRTLGRFREVESVIGTETIRGPSGRTGRVDLRLGYERASTRGSVSFRWEDGEWKMLGLSVEVPDRMLSGAGAEQARRDRVQGNAEELKRLASALLERSLGRSATDTTPAIDSDPAAVWRDAAPGFRDGITVEAFERTEADHRRTLGAFRRVLDVTSATISPGQTSTSIDCLIEFDKATINGTLKFSKVDGVWRLTYYKLVLPLPRLPE
ncbi:MAG: hypothetical protein R3B06_29215 [Kofleriaceae bacterium]